MQTVEMRLPDDLQGAFLELARNAFQVVVSESRNSNQVPEYMDATTASKYLNVSRNTFYKWVKLYSVPLVDIDGIKRYRRIDLDNFMNQHKN